MDNVKINIRYINDLISSEIKKITCSNILHYRSSDLSMYKSTVIKHHLKENYSTNRISDINISIEKILHDIFNDILSLDELSYINSNDIKNTSKIVSNGNFISYHKEYVNFYEFKIYKSDDKTTILNPYLKFNDERVVLFDVMSIDIKLNSYTIDAINNIISFEFLYYFDLKNLKNKKIFINE